MMDRLSTPATTAGATAAVTYPWWITQLPELLAPWVAVGGGVLLVVTIGAKIADWRLSCARRRALDAGRAESSEAQFD